MSTRKSKQSKARKQSNSPAVEVRNAASYVDSATRGSLVPVRFPGVGFPDRLSCTLRYEDVYNLAGGVSNPGAQVWLLNSCYKPDSTNPGHQPNSFDQLTAIYNKYLVTHVDYMIELYNLATAATRFAVVESELDISGKTVDQLAETKYMKSGILGRADGGEPYIVVRGSVNLSRLMGQRLLDPDSTMYAVVNASPSDGAFLILKISTLDGTNANVYARVFLHYHVTFKDRAEPNQSLDKSSDLLDQPTSFTPGRTIYGVTDTIGGKPVTNKAPPPRTRL